MKEEKISVENYLSFEEAKEFLSKVHDDLISLLEKITYLITKCILPWMLFI
ncbi:hypothetical protein [Dickeya fangzhongdai]|uniref:hypothetical protein n=1 Tax=Dickeya fangzhongdai TaxID=1778540 RepID=UPI0026E0F520|nr:hypothetical protein [Dickeya fangzhongdai]WKV52151.1 hypothetical protein PL145_08035 [Dickeya fangzhongdai]